MRSLTVLMSIGAIIFPSVSTGCDSRMVGLMGDAGGGRDLGPRPDGGVITDIDASVLDGGILDVGVTIENLTCSGEKYYGLTTGGWQTEYVEIGRSARMASNRSVAVDSADRLHLVYGGGNLYHTYHDGTTWRCEIVDNQPGTGQQASIAIDGDGFIHISYIDGLMPGRHSLRHATNLGGKWSTEAIDDSEYVGDSNTIAVDDNGSPHVVYWDPGRFRVMYATKEADRWNIETVDDTGGPYASMALDSLGEPHVVYTGHQGVVYAVKEGAHWNKTFIDRLEIVTGNVSIDVGRGDSVSVTYFNPGLKFAVLDNGLWIRTSLDEIADKMQFSSITSDRFGEKHIALLNGGIAYLHTKNGRWIRNDLGDAPGHPADRNSDNIAIAVNSAAIPSLVFGNTDLLTGYSDGWRATNLDRDIAAGLSPSAAADHEGDVHVVYGVDSALRYGKGRPGNWNLETVSQTGRDAGDAAIVIGHDGTPRLSSVYRDVYQDTDALDLLSRAPDGTWKQRTLDRGQFGSYSHSDNAVLKDGTDFIVYEAREYQESGESRWTRFAKGAGEEWESGLVDQGENPSVVAGLNGEPAVFLFRSVLEHREFEHSYFDASDGRWRTETIASSEYAAAAAAPDGTLHVLWYDETELQLKHLSYRKGRWNVDSALPLEDYSGHLDLFIDANDVHHSVFIDGRKIMYSSEVDGIWTVSVLDELNCLSVYCWQCAPKIVVDRSWRPVVFYFDPCMNGLKVAVRPTTTTDP